MGAARTVILSQSSSLTPSIMNDPIIISTPADAHSGTAPKRGAKKRETRKRRPAVTPVSPVRPPSRMPAGGADDGQSFLFRTEFRILD